VPSVGVASKWELFSSNSVGTVALHSLSVLTTNSLAVRRFDSHVTADHESARAWQGYLDRFGPGLLYHRLAWDQVWKTYGLPITRLTAWRGDQIVGVLPLVSQRSLWFPNQMVSLPWFDTAGILADDDEARLMLWTAALEIAGRSGAEQLELRFDERIDEWLEPRMDKVLMRLRLQPDPAELWNSFAPKVRNQVRKAQKSGLAVTSGGRELLAEFFAVYSENMRDLGSPSHSLAFFQSVLEAFPGLAHVHVVRLDDRAVGAGLTIQNDDRIEIPWASSLKRYNSLCVNHLLYWHLLERACQGGFQWFHFGRSTVDTGPYRFKKQWGSETKPLYWYKFDLRTGQARDSLTVGERFQWAVAIWKTLPVAITRRLGPSLIAKVP
jgi:FemAB-related protein (PEP-CTERM system-associated)